MDIVEGVADLHRHIGFNGLRRRDVSDLEPAPEGEGVSRILVYVHFPRPVGQLETFPEGELEISRIVHSRKVECRPVAEIPFPSAGIGPLVQIHQGIGRPYLEIRAGLPGEAGCSVESVNRAEIVLEPEFLRYVRVKAADNLLVQLGRNPGPEIVVRILMDLGSRH